MNARLLTCDHCAAHDDLWVVNPAGGYGRHGLWACTCCLAGVWSGLVPRLLEVYSDEDAGKLRAALEERAEIDRIIGIVRGTEGWHKFGLDMDEIHYVRGEVSLCRRWTYTYGGDVFQPSLAARSRCAECISEFAKGPGEFAKTAP